MLQIQIGLFAKKKRKKIGLITFNFYNT